MAFPAAIGPEEDRMQTCKDDSRGSAAARGRRLRRRARSLGECRERGRARVRGACRTSTGRASISCAAAGSWSGHSRAASPACAFRSARASAAPRLQRRATLIVPDVHASRATSPAMRRRTRRSSCRSLAGDRLIGVLDLDSPRLDRFTAGRRAPARGARAEDRRRLRLAARRHRRVLSRRGRTPSRKVNVPSITSRARCRRRCAYRP